MSQPGQVDEIAAAAASPASGQTPRLAGAGPGSLASPVILIAEDSELQARVLQLFLERHHFRVVLAQNGREALAALQARPVSLVISDVEMPGLNGYDLCLAIKSHPAHRAIPVILLTALAGTGDILQGLKCKADYYLTKPYNQRFLLEHVQALLAQPAFSPEAEDVLPGLELVLNGQRHLVTTGRRPMLNLLLSTYECATQQNRELIQTQRELGQRNGQLQAQTQRLQVSERNFRSLLENNVDGMVVVDRQGQVRFGNPAAHNLLAKAGPELLGQPFDLPFDPSGSSEVRIARPGRATIVAELRVTETIWEGEAAKLISLRDITQRKLDEEKIREQQAKLEEANAKLQALATLDGLTGLKNHRAFKQRLEEEFERARRFHQPLSLVLLDVDRFKLFNDAFGHPAGDEVLRTVAQLLQRNTRQTDFVARYGGEEFAVLLPNTGPTEAIFLAERIRQAIEDAPWPKRAITVSLGVAFLDESFPDGAALVSAADQALYRSKQAGRNRLTPAGAPTPAELALLP